MDPIQYIRSKIQVGSESAAPDGSDGSEQGHDRVAPLLGMMVRPVCVFFEALGRINFVSATGGRFMFELEEAPFSATFVLYLTQGGEKSTGRHQFCILDVDVREQLPYFYCFDSTAEEKRFREAEEMLRAFARDFVQEVKPWATAIASLRSTSQEMSPPALSEHLEGLFRTR